MFTTTANSARIWGILFAALALFSAIEVAMVKQSILIPMLGLIGFGALAAAYFMTRKRLSAAGQSAGKNTSLELGLQVVGIVAILARMYFRYLA
jgi:hypothetical protein